MIKRCPAVGCDQLIDGRYLFCKAHWLSLPEAARGFLWQEAQGIRHGRSGAVVSYEEALNHAIEYLEVLDGRTSEPWPILDPRTGHIRTQKEE